MNITEDEEYVCRFICHDEAHEVAIDLKCFAKALKPYLVQPKEEKREWKPGDCPHCGRPMPSAPEEKKECGCPSNVIAHCHDPKCPHPSHALEKPSAPTISDQDKWHKAGYEDGFRAGQAAPTDEVEEKKECGPGIVKNGIYECACIKQPSAPTDDLEEQIRKIWVGCTMEEGVKRLSALARKTK